MKFKHFTSDKPEQINTDRIDLVTNIICVMIIILYTGTKKYKIRQAENKIVNQNTVYYYVKKSKI